ncbi:MAG: RNA pyrophosphohydrolase [Gammaproteobacteria bacterium]|nr:RNA pyrophosphohydrolase [Gammaproteobacteria bacterium]
MIDSEGYRANVGAVVCNAQGQLLWARRIGAKDAWQFPQGGINKNESVEAALYRELHEELGLGASDVDVLAKTQGWLSYRLPKRFRRYRTQPLCIGQKQKWFLLQLKTAETSIQLDVSTEPEFDAWRWVDYWYPLDHVISFKRDVYLNMLQEFEEYITALIANH